MSILDSIKEKVSGLLESHGDKVTEGLDKVGEQLDGGIQGGIEKAKDALGNIDGKSGS